jgi:serine/threonine-protein kinase
MLPWGAYTSTTVSDDTHSLLGQTIGHIRVVDVLGEGGMGAVYVGFDETLQRKVALKAIRSEFRLDPESKARFLREARILSQLDHPSVCKVHDFIEGDDNDYLVLELIPGRSLRGGMSSDLDQNVKLRVAEELLEVLAVVHARGVVHRDLKPENVMMVPDDGIKVLDFGLARSLDEGVDYSQIRTVANDRPRKPAECDAVIPSSDLQTTRGLVLGTVGYMSPEQARGEPATAASDMYSVGLMLQELFTGEAPFDRTLDRLELLGNAARGESRPVVGLSSDLTRLIERLKSLAPGARPSSVDALEMMRRIIDRPHRRRRRAMVVAVWLVLGLLTIGMAVQSRRAARAAQLAEKEAATARQATEFLVEMFEAANPEKAAGRQITARELLDNGASRLESELIDQPLVRATLQRTIGWVYFELGLYDDAERLLDQALEAQEQLLGPDNLEVALCLNNLGSVYWAQRRLEEAAQSYERCLSIRQRICDPDDPLLAKSYNNLALAYTHQGRHRDAEPLFREAIRVFEKVHGPDHPDLARSLNSLANLLRDRGEYEEAEALLLRAIRIQEKLGENHPHLGTCLHSLANVYMELDRLDEAEALFLRSGEILETALGSSHPYLAVNRRVLAMLYCQQKRFDEAEPLLQRALAIREVAFGPEHVNTIQVLEDLAGLQRDWGRPELAVPYLLRVLAIRERTLGPHHQKVAETAEALAAAYSEAGRAEQAREMELRAAAIRAALD